MFTHRRAKKNKILRKKLYRLKQAEQRKEDFIKNNKKLWAAQYAECKNNQTQSQIGSEAVDKSRTLKSPMINDGNMNLKIDVELKNFFVKSKAEECLGDKTKEILEPVFSSEIKISKNSKKSTQKAKTQNKREQRGISRKRRKAERKKLSKNFKSLLKSFDILTITNTNSS